MHANRREDEVAGSLPDLVQCNKRRHGFRLALLGGDGAPPSSKIVARIRDGGVASPKHSLYRKTIHSMKQSGLIQHTVQEEPLGWRRLNRVGPARGMQNRLHLGRRQLALPDCHQHTHKASHHLV